ncbi:hypothetical protein KS461_09965 [Pseudomonas chlororaphis]|nr:hypothetical protein [Pseudomonas chlororaphis]UVE47586.1 hypothetical protein KS461_09965 [Pseudomonas chlororaphis]
MSAYDLWLEPPDEPDEAPEADPEPENDYYPPGDYGSDDRQIMLERRYEQ